MTMMVTKRDGRQESVSFDKILKRINQQSKKLNVDGIKIAQQVILGLYDGVTTQELDDLAARTAFSQVSTHPDYSKLASNISISRLHKETKPFFEATEDLFKAGYLNNEYFTKVKKYRSLIETKIDYQRDYQFEYFGIKTLEQGYLLKINGKVAERPQCMYMRIALTLFDDFEEISDYYDRLSTFKISAATPIAYNSGTVNQNLISCALIQNKGDSLEDLCDTYKDVARTSADAAGIGLGVTNIRSKESTISTSGGKAAGILKQLKIYNELARCYNQNGKRNGSFAIYLEIWHKDIQDLLDMRKETGKDELRAKDLFSAVWIPDNFMKAVENNGNYYLMCPNEIKKAGLKPLQELYGEEFENEYNKAVELGLGKVIKAQDLYRELCVAQIETGLPYVAFKDHINNKTNHKNYGTITQSNLCVAPETLLLTNEGYKKISELENKNVVVWNGLEWSNSTVVKTGENQKLIKINFSNGQSIECTEYHKFYVQKGYNRGTGDNKLIIEEKRAFELNKGDKIIKYETPLIEFSDEFENPYTQGFFTGDGCTYNNNNHIDLYHEKNDLIEYIKGEKIGLFNEKQKKQRIRVSNLYKKYNVPINYNVKSRIEWLEGLSDSDGVLCKNANTQSIQISSINLEFLKNVHLMLQTLGVQSKVIPMLDEGYRIMPDGKGSSKSYLCKKTYRLMFGADAIYKLQKLGFNPKRLKLNGHIPNRNAEQFVKVVSVENNGRYDDTYCLNEPLRNKVVFNGVLTGNCIEIMQYVDKKTQAICTLSSLPLQSYVSKGKFNFEELGESVKYVTKALNNVFKINKYSTEEAKNGGLKQRAIGIGVQGLADVFALLDMEFGDDKSKKLNKDIFETIYYFALLESNRIAKEDGIIYDGFIGSPASEGILQYDMWGKTEEVESNSPYDWKSLKESIKQYGLANSLVTALMPTQSSANIIGSNEGFEPFVNNIYSRKVLSGEYVIVNKYLVKDLEKLSLWNETLKNRIIMNNGSIQNISEIPDTIKIKYKTVWEMKMKTVIEMASDRGIFIDQSQSMNLFVSDPSVPILSSIHMYSWKSGLKTGMYYLRSRRSLESQKSLAIQTTEKEVPKPTEEEKIACSIEAMKNGETCDMCSS